MEPMHNKKRSSGRSSLKTAVPEKILKEIIALAQTSQSTGTTRKYSATITEDGIVAIDNGIEGWMNGEDLLWLLNTAKEMDHIVEVGSWKGRSTYALLSGCKGTVYAIDHFLGSATERESYQAEVKTRDIYKDFMKNVGSFKNLQVLKMDNAEAVKQFEDNSIDMVFIDAGHTYEEVLNDIKQWLPKVKKIICGHDLDNEQVEKAVREIFSNKFEISKGDIWIKRIC